MVYYNNSLLMEIKETVLTINIENGSPVELTELVKSLASLSSQYQSYASREGFTDNERQARLYIRQIRSGSIILDLYEMASATVLPFTEHINTIVGFAGHIKSVYDYALSKDPEAKKPVIDVNDMRELSAFLSPIANDNASQINIDVTINGNVENNIYLDSTQANAIQNRLKGDIKELSEPKSGDLHNNVLMVFSQTRSDLEKSVGNKVVIDDITPKKSYNVIFSDKKLKRAILKGEDNPLNFVWQVDVKVKMIGGKVCAYEVIKLNDKFPIPNDNT